jgi:hypothetical protein
MQKYTGAKEVDEGYEILERRNFREENRGAVWSKENHYSLLIFVLRLVYGFFWSSS